MKDFEDLLMGFPVLHRSETEYSRGWNDCYKAVIHMLENKPGKWVKDGYVPLPQSQAEAEMMHLISENWLKHNVTSEVKEQDGAG